MGRWSRSVWLQLSNTRLCRLVAGIVVLSGAALVLLVAVLAAAGVVPELLSSKDGGWSIAALSFGVVSVLSGIVLGVSANMIHLRLEQRLNRRLGEASRFFRNHDLSKVVGQAIQMILLEAAEGLDHTRYRPIKAKADQSMVLELADKAPEYWHTVVLASQNKAAPPWPGLHDSELWQFLNDPNATAMEQDAWKDLIRWLNDGNTVAFEDPEAESILTERLVGRFGLALREALKEDFVNGGYAWSGIMMLSVGKIIESLGGTAQHSPALTASYQRLCAEMHSIRSIVEQLCLDQGARHDEIKAWFGDISREVRGVARALADTRSKLDGQEHRLLSRMNELTRQASTGREANLDQCPPLPTLPANTVRRPGVTRAIDEMLRRGTDAGVSQAAARSDGGMGKSIAALLYADEYARQYPGGRFFVSAARGQLVKNLATMARRWGIAEEESRAAARSLGIDTNDRDLRYAAALRRRIEALRQADGTPAPSLMILDNVDDLALWAREDIQRLLPGPPCRRLITTRIEHLLPGCMVPVGQLTEAESLALFRNYRPDSFGGLNGEPTAAELATMRQIHRDLEGFAVAIAAVAIYMALSPGLSWAGYWNSKSSKSVDYLPDAQPGFDRYLPVIGDPPSSARNSAAVIADAYDALPPPEKRALEYAALLPEDTAPRRWLADLLLEDSKRPEGPNTLVLPNRDGYAGREAEAVIDHLEALQLLRDAGDDGMLLSLHRVWRFHRREHLARPGGTPALRSATDLELMNRIEAAAAHAATTIWERQPDECPGWEITAAYRLYREFEYLGRRPVAHLLLSSLQIVYDGATPLVGANATEVASFVRELGLGSRREPTGDNR